jgi:hypothetical protein
MSNIKSLSLTLQNAVKVEVVSSCVWTHTAPYASINTYEGETMFVSAALAVSKSNSEYTFTSIFVTTKEAGDWMHRFDITKHELIRLAAYQFVKGVPSLLAKAYGIHADGFARLKSDEAKEETRKMSGAFLLDFNGEVENGIREFRMESVSKDDPIVTIENSSTVADATDDITNQNS